VNGCARQTHEVCLPICYFVFVSSHSYFNFVHRVCNICHPMAHELAALGSFCSLDAEPNLVVILSCIQSVLADDSASFE
jgi:hypothetical protein